MSESESPTPPADALDASHDGESLAGEDFTAEPEASDPNATATAPSPPDGERRRIPVGVVVVLVLSVLLVLGSVFTYAATNGIARSRYHAAVESGEAIAIVRVPRFGDDWAVPVVEGTSLAALRQGLGWYADTVGAGEVGNFALAGHRFGWGEPFSGLAGLEPGDEIIVEANGRRHTYRVEAADLTIARDSSELLDAVPNGPGLVPTRAVITLTTSATRLPSPNLTVVIGVLEDSTTL
ncbi:MAG: sortase [Propionibacteriaceae bacterium]|jgi:LPXTG-site transpeptidase (sortase) family protein|nr:sortase [Propionibacteriaceae bacterium]